MRRGAKPTKAKVKAKPPLARRSPKDEGSRVHDLEKRLAEAVAREAEALKRESEVLEQQTATAEILKVISESPTGVQPVFDAIVESCTRLLACNHATLRVVKGDRAEFAASSSTQEGKRSSNLPCRSTTTACPFRKRYCGGRWCRFRTRPRRASPCR